MQKQNITRSMLLSFLSLTIYSNVSNAETVKATGAGQLILNIDHDKMKNHDRQRESPRGSGNFVSYSSFIEHYFDQPTANQLKGFELTRNANDGYQPEASTNNLVFGMNGHEVDHPLTTIDPSLFPNPDDFRDGFHHYLQNTTMAYQSDDFLGTVAGKLGFGGVLRIGFGDLTPGNDPDLGFGVQGIGDFSLSYDRDESKWVLLSNTGRGNPDHKRGIAPFDLTEVQVDMSVEDQLTISGVLTSSRERDGRFVPLENLGTFSMTASTAVVPVPAAVWLFGSGLLGLLGVKRKRK